MTLYCHETPRRLTVAHHKLCAAFHEPATASYNIVVFKTTQKSKCFIQIHIIMFLGTSIAFKLLRHFSIYSVATTAKQNTLDIWAQVMMVMMMMMMILNSKQANSQTKKQKLNKLNKNDQKGKNKSKRDTK